MQPLSPVILCGCTEDNSSGTTTMVLDSIAEKSTPYEGQPRVVSVLAKQIAKLSMLKSGFVALSQDAAGYGDKSQKSNSGSNQTLLRCNGYSAIPLLIVILLLVLHIKLVDPFSLVV